MITNVTLHRKHFLVQAKDDPILCLLDHLLAMTFCDDVFERPITLTNIFKVGIPEKFIRLTMRNDVLDLPIFREPERHDGERGTSRTKPLKAAT